MAPALAGANQRYYITDIRETNQRESIPAVRASSITELSLPETKADPQKQIAAPKRKNPAIRLGFFWNLERETRFELATPTLARLCSTN